MIVDVAAQVQAQAKRSPGHAGWYRFCRQARSQGGTQTNAGVSVVTLAVLLSPCREYLVKVKTRKVWAYIHVGRALHMLDCKRFDLTSSSALS